MSFEAKRLERVRQGSNKGVSPDEALKIAALDATSGNVHALLVVIETNDGDHVVISSDTTYAEQLWLLERAKLTILK